ncbi:hypothetical protein BDP81DRAFT_454543 [Colletotrichum phormii]|uniref:Uncharacterized protein n=1 Tax=Colletotrichum phormii TaxID=359342 RepID=A0AAI9ZFQ1_9PEZI|nr:uncharacterized protein BDP81DRAFT_454543 [Colletotrichum phormii]KAK1623437.1 hypothetical protein BDP81DRAFT_454543 [Colletotrichum phormii]
MELGHQREPGTDRTHSSHKARFGGRFELYLAIVIGRRLSTPYTLREVGRKGGSAFAATALNTTTTTTTIYTPDPTILFVGAVNAGLTFKIFEYQAVLAAQLLAGRVPSSRLPSTEAQLAWEVDRIAKRGDGPKFALVFPDFKEYFEELRRIAGPPTEDGKGRELPPFNKSWFERFMQGHERRKNMWRRLNAQAMATLESRDPEGSLRPKL